MPQQNSSLQERIRINFKEPPKFNVVFHNDDFTPMDFVVFVLVSIFSHDFASAEQIMLKVHIEGQGVAGSYSWDIAQSKRIKTIEMARNEGYPLRVEVVKA